MLRIPFEWLEFPFKCLESLSNGSNLNLNASNAFRIVRIGIRMLRISFEWLEFAFECFESLRMCIGMVEIPFEWFEFGFESFESISNCSNEHSNASNPFRKV